MRLDPQEAERRGFGRIAKPRTGTRHALFPKVPCAPILHTYFDPKNPIKRIL